MRQILGVALLLMGLFAVMAGADETLNFNPDWRFIKADPAQAQSVGFNDSTWKKVSAPHTYNDVDTFDNWSPAGHKGEMDQWGGRTWYRKHFVAPQAWQGKKVFIEFEAVRQWAEVYLNGEKLGLSENGFLPFGFDLTPFLKIGQPNVLAVMCDNSFVKDEEGKHKWGAFEGGAKLPWNNPHWHPAHGGIYRNVYLHIKDPLHLTLPLFSTLKTEGTYLYATDLSRKSAILNVEAQIKNDTGKSAKFIVKSELLDRDGKVLLSLVVPAKLAVGEMGKVKLSGRVKNPQLWEPSYPYLYTVRTTILQKNKVIDSNQIPFGFRWVKFDKTSGFYINDRYVKLQGWGQKSIDEWPGLGAAQPDWMHDYTLKLMHDAGGNFVRWGHTAGAPAHIQAANRYGIATLQPGVDGEKDVTGHPWKIRLETFRDMIIYYRNNPSIIIWEGGNQSVSKEHVEAIKAVVEKYDPYGGRAYAHRRCNATVAPYCDITISTEGSGYQKSLPTVEGEYNREESPRRIWDDFSPPTFGYKNAVGTYKLNSEQYAVNQIFQYEKIAPRAHCGGANWIFSDSTSGGRVQTEVARASGEVDGVRLPKEAYWVCKVLFTDAPDLHIIGHWTYPKGTVKDIYVAADCDEVELFINGKSKGRKKAYTGSSDQKKGLNKHLFTFPKVAWAPGSIKAVGYQAGKPVAEQQIETVGKAVALKITPILGPKGFLATGSDVALFDVEAVDAQGRRCPTFQQRCDFAVKGSGVWRGGYNSGKEKSTNHTYLDLECGINRVAIRSTRASGTVSLTARSAGLKSATVTVEAKPVAIKNGMTLDLPVVPAQGTLTPLPAPNLNEQSVAMVELTPAQKRTEFFADISYSGPSAAFNVMKIRKGAELFTDNAIALKKIPSFLKGGEFVQLPNADWNYSAVDLLQFDCPRDAVITIAQDARLTPMPWLTKNFKNTGQTLKSGKHTWTLYSRTVKKGESVLLGSNTEIKSPKRWMMIIFASKP